MRCSHSDYRQRISQVAEFITIIIIIIIIIVNIIINCYALFEESR